MRTFDSQRFSLFKVEKGGGWIPIFWSVGRGEGFASRAMVGPSQTHQVLTYMLLVWLRNELTHSTYYLMEVFRRDNLLSIDSSVNAGGVCYVEECPLYPAPLSFCVQHS